MVDLVRDPGEGLARRRGEVVPQAKEVGEEEGGEEAVVHLVSSGWERGGPHVRVLEGEGA